MAGMVGRQIDGLAKQFLKLKIATNPAMQVFSLRQMLVMGTIFDENKVTRVRGRYHINTFIPPFPSLAYDRFLKNLHGFGEGVRTPNIANIAVTSRCICKCWHCSFSDRIDCQHDDLPLETVQDTVRQLLDAGTCLVGITGGEPLLREDLEDIIRAVDDRAATILFTTGYKLTPERVSRLKGAGLDMVCISLDHYRPEIHDKGRGVPGMFDYAVKAIRMFQDAGVYTAVSFVPNRELISDRKETQKTLDFFKEMEINDMRLTSPILAGKIKGDAHELLTRQDRDFIWSIQKKLVKTKGYPGVFAYDYFESKHFYGCGAGWNFLFIDSRGNACPCDFTAMSFGNIRERPVADIWKDMSDRFRLPGSGCYADVISDAIAEKPPEALPLSLEESKDLHARFPSYDKNDVPAFFRKLGVRENRKG